MKFYSNILFLLLTLPAFGATYYVRPAGGTYGAEDGSSWANAFDGFSDVAWGGGANQVGAGDTLYVGAGTYTQKLTPGASGTAGNPITIRAAQETQIGVATFSGSGSAVDGSGISYVIINGEYNGGRNFNFAENINYQNMNFCEAWYFTMTNACMLLQFSASNRVAYGVIDCGSNEDFCINGEGSDNIDAYDQTFIHNNILIMPGQQSDGDGADGLKIGAGFTVFSNFIGNYTGTYYKDDEPDAEHQDLIAHYGNNYTRIFANEFGNTGDAGIGYDGAGSSEISHVKIYNNVFRFTTVNMGAVMVRFYSASGPVTDCIDIQIDNNTFIDASRTTLDYGSAIRLHTGGGTTTATDCSIRNNIIYNCGDNWNAILIQGFTDNWNFSNNRINAGAHGNALTSSWVQDNGQTGAPSFVSYTEYATSGNDFRLTAADDNGATLTGFSVDKNNINRPQRTVWGLGAFEYPASESSGPVANVGTMNAGNTYLR